MENREYFFHKRQSMGSPFKETTSLIDIPSKAAEGKENFGLNKGEFFDKISSSCKLDDEGREWRGGYQKRYQKV